MLKCLVLSLTTVVVALSPGEAVSLPKIRPSPASKSTVSKSRVSQSSPSQVVPAKLGSPRSTPVRRAQVTSVSQLSDVQPTDWAYQALQSLIERYGCVAGVPDGTFQGSRSLTRYEFAAGLNACLDRFAAVAPSIDPDEWTTIQRLQREFADELSALRRRIETVGDRVATLEDREFSPTLVMGGESIFALSAGFGGEPPGEGTTNPVFTHLTRLGFVGSFTGRDRLRFEFQAANFSNRGFANPAGFNSDMALLSYQGNTNNSVELSKLEYRFATFSDRVVFTVRPLGFSLSSVLTANSPYFDAGRGSISRFTEASPAFKLGRLESGVGFDWLVTDTVRLQAAYGARDADNPNDGRGFFNSEHSAAGVQLLLKPSPNLLAGVSYINAYSANGRLDTFTGSFIADTNSFIDEPAQINAVSGTLQWRLARDLTFSTWGAWFFTDALESEARSTTTTYLFALGYSDPFGNDGDLLAFLFGQPPKLVDGENLVFGEDEDTSLHFELFYRLRLTDRISITPGVFVVTNPEHDSDSDALVVGTIRTTFRF